MKTSEQKWVYASTFIPQGKAVPRRYDQKLASWGVLRSTFRQCNAACCKKR